MSDGLRGQKVVVVVVPIPGRDGESVGGIAGLFRLGPGIDSALYSSVEKLRREESNCVYLVDGNGIAIYHSNPDRIGEDFSAQAVVGRVLNGEVDALRTRDFDGQDIVASFAPVPGTSWGLVTEESWAALTASSRRYGQFLLLLLALGVVAPALIVTVGVRRITQPIAKLIRAAQQMAGGNFGQRIAASTGDEIEELAQQFNHMAAQLEESYANLEQKVTHRTRELATLNAIAVQVSRSLDLEEILNDALDEALEVMGMERGQAFCLDEETQSLILMAHRGLPDATRLPLEVDAAGQAARAGHPIVKEVADCPEGKARVSADEREVSQLVVCIPLIAKGRTVGAINLSTHTPCSVAPEELSLLEAIGHQIGVAVENARLYEQAQQLAVMKERNRLARDLHDSVTQALYGVTLYAEAAARQLSLGEVGMTSDHLREIRATAQEALREMRLLIFELRSPMLRQEGLAAALQARLETVEGRLGLKTEFRGEENGQLSPEVEEGLYRVAQEALNNVLKHAHASRVTVFLHQDEQAVTLEVADDGRGFDPVLAREQGGFGLRGMEERAARLGGKLVVQSSLGEGTRIRVEVCQ
jgi:nitrate/nitrite-specific signal transduction histidine kinase